MPNVDEQNVQGVNVRNLNYFYIQYAIHLKKNKP